MSAAELRARADAALAEGRHGDALVDGFRALAARQVERGRLDDLPGATAHEVADALGAAYPAQRGRVDGSAALFDRVLYGDRPASREQATGVLGARRRAGGAGDEPGRLGRGAARAGPARWSSPALPSPPSLVVAARLGAGGVRTATALDPDNPGPDGAQAVARVLDDQGVDVTVVRGADALDGAPAPGRATTVRGHLDRPARRQHQPAAARRHAAAPTWCWSRPGPGPPRRSGSRRRPLAVAPDEPRRRPAAPTRVRRAARSRSTRADAYAAADGCFGGEAGALVAAAPRRAGPARAPTGPSPTTRCCAADNAAVALRLLGSSDRLVWYVPDARRPGRRRRRQPAPPCCPGGCAPPCGSLGVAAVALVLWRARRLGPLATEPLPVVVQGHRDHPQPGPALPPRRRPRARRRGAAARPPAPASRSGCGSAGTPSPAPLVRDVARLLDRPVDEVDALLGDGAPPPATDHDLITLAGRPGRARQRGTPRMSDTGSTDRAPTGHRPPRLPPTSTRERLAAVRAEVAKAVVGPGRRRVRPAGRAAVRRARADGGRAGRGQDAAGAHPRRRALASTPGGCSSPPT